MKKLAFTGFLLLSILVSFSANRYLVSGGTGNWNSTTNWSANSGGSSGASFPVAGDAVIIDTNSHNANVSVNVTSACASVNIDNAYTGTISMDAGLTTTSTVKLGTGMTLTGASAWTMNTSCAITGSGKSFPALTLGGTSQTFTLADTLRVSGLLTLNGTTATTFSGAYDILCGTLTFTTAKTVTLSGNVISNGLTTNTPATVLNGSFTLATGGFTATGAMSGTTQIKLTGGTWSGGSNISNTSLTMDGNVTISGSVAYSTGTIIYASGTITTTGSTLTCGTGTTFNTSGMNWNNVTLSGTSQTHTLQSNLNLTGTLTLSGTTATTFSGAYNIVTGNLTFGTAETVTIPSGLSVSGLSTVTGATVLNGTFTLYTGGIAMNAALTGTYTDVVFNSTGTWSGSTAITKNVTINTSGTLTIGTNAAYNTGTLTYTTGTVTTTGSTLTCAAGTTFNCPGIAWNKVIFGGTSQTFTLQNDLDINGLFTCNGTTATTINGAYNLKLGGGYTQTTVLLVSGTATFLFDGTGTWAGGSTLKLTNNLRINTADTLLIGANVAYGTGNFIYTAGTVTTTGSTLTLTSAIDLTTGVNLITWNNITLSGTSQTYNLVSNFVVSGTLGLSGTTALTLTGASNISCAALTLNTSVITIPCDITIAGTTTVSGATVFSGSVHTIYTSGLSMNSSLAGTVKVILTGGGNWSGSGNVATNLTLAGNTTIIGTVVFYGTSAGDTLAYSSGNITTTGSTLACYAPVSGTVVLNLPGISLNHLSLINGNFYVTLMANLDVNGNLSMQCVSTPSEIVITGGTITVGGNLSFTGGNYAQYWGTTKIIMDGTGTLSSTYHQYLALDLTINTAGTITISDFYYTPHQYNYSTVFTYISGTVVCTGTLFTGGLVNPNFNTSGMTWNNVYIGAGANLQSDMNISGNMTLPGLGYGFNGAFNYKISGSLNFANTGAVSGSSSFLLNGTGTLSANIAGTIGCPVIINTNGTITFGTSINLSGTSFTYTAGTIVSSGSTITCLGNPSTFYINASGFNLDQFSSSTAVNFLGSQGFSMNTFNCTTASKIFTFGVSKTYTINKAITVVGTAASPCLFKSSSAGTQANITLGATAIQDMGFCAATDINSSSGQKIWTYKGALGNAANWRQIPTEPRTEAYTF